MDVFPVTWSSSDDEHGCRVTLVGKTPEGESACVHVRFTPYFFVAASSVANAKLLLAQCERRFEDDLHPKSRVVARKSLWGFRGGRQEPFVQLVFYSSAAARKARWALAKEHDTYEGGMDPIMRLCHLRDLQPCKWVHVSSWRTPEHPEADVDVEIECSHDAVGPSDRVTRPPLVYASFDIEAYSATGNFPVADNVDDKLIQIATAFQRYGEAEPYLRSVVCLGETDDVEGAAIVWREHEHEVINAWARLLREQKTDVLLGWNTHQFDWRYISGRCGVLLDEEDHTPLVDVELLGKFVEGGGAVREFELNSGAFGQNKFFVMQTPGVQQLDLLQYVRREFKLASYTLKNVSLHFLGDMTKLDLSASEIFARFRGSSADRAEIARYAIRDTELPLRLLAKLSVWENLTEMANAVRVPIDYLLNRGQQIKVYSVIYGKARSLGFVVPDDKAIGLPEGKKYEGATVLDAKSGAYFDVVTGLDFASLAKKYSFFTELGGAPSQYPSIIRAHNMCYSTLVLDAKYDAFQDTEYYEIDTSMGRFRFAQSPRGVVPALLEDLAVHRKLAKKDMAAAKAAGDDWGAALANGRQLAMKITMNSVYGFLGATKGMLPIVPIAASVTATGRRMIQETKRLVEELVPGSKVVYGDSVAGYTPCIVRVGGTVEVTTFELLAERFGDGVWRACDGGGDGDGDDKEACDGGGDGDGDKEACELRGVEVWSDDGWTIMERVIRHRVSKPMVRVVTHTGVVDVTEDHSLLRDDGTPVRPRDVSVGDTLLHAPLPQLQKGSSSMSIAEARVRGFFADADKGVVHIDQKSQLSAACIFLLADTLGYKVSVNTRRDKPHVYRMTMTTTTSQQRKNPIAIKKLHPIDYDGEYVYDVTTHTHRFAAGVGRLVVHNTDSVMVILGVPEGKRHDMHAHFEVASRVAAQISATFRPPNELEFEKCYYPYLLFSKKRYAGERRRVPAQPYAGPSQERLFFLTSVVYLS